MVDRVPTQADREKLRDYGAEFLEKLEEAEPDWDDLVLLLGVMREVIEVEEDEDEDEDEEEEA